MGGAGTLAVTLDLIEMLDWLRAVPDHQHPQNTTLAAAGDPEARSGYHFCARHRTKRHQW
jgi:hypothetical protein